MQTHRLPSPDSRPPKCSWKPNHSRGRRDGRLPLRCSRAHAGCRLARLDMCLLDIDEVGDDELRESWQLMEDLLRDSFVRNIGVISTGRHPPSCRRALMRLLARANVAPAVLALAPGTDDPDPTLCFGRRSSRGAKSTASEFCHRQRSGLLATTDGDVRRRGRGSEICAGSACAPPSACGTSRCTHAGVGCGRCHVGGHRRQRTAGAHGILNDGVVGHARYTPVQQRGGHSHRLTKPVLVLRGRQEIANRAECIVGLLLQMRLCSVPSDRSGQRAALACRRTTASRCCCAPPLRHAASNLLATLTTRWRRHRASQTIFRLAAGRRRARATSTRDTLRVRRPRRLLRRRRGTAACCRRWRHPSRRLRRSGAAGGSRRWRERRRPRVARSTSSPAAVFPSQHLASATLAGAPLRPHYYDHCRRGHRERARAVTWVGGDKKGVDKKIIRPIRHLRVAQAGHGEKRPRSPMCVSERGQVAQRDQFHNQSLSPLRARVARTFFQCSGLRFSSMNVAQIALLNSSSGL